MHMWTPKLVCVAWHALAPPTPAPPDPTHRDNLRPDDHHHEMPTLTTLRSRAIGLAAASADPCALFDRCGSTPFTRLGHSTRTVPSRPDTLTLRSLPHTTMLACDPAHPPLAVALSPRPPTRPPGPWRQRASEWRVSGICARETVLSCCDGAERRHESNAAPGMVRGRVIRLHQARRSPKSRRGGAARASDLSSGYFAR